MSNTAVRESTPSAVANHGGRPLIMADFLQQEVQQRELLGQFVSHCMVDGTDYGVIPGTKNKTLLKPGAEKLVTLFKCLPKFTIEEKTEDWTSGLFFYRFSCQVITQADGSVVAEGVGSCSTFESRYRWRQANRRCPACGAEAIIKGKAEFGGGWVCFKKKDGCGAKFADDAPEITDQVVGRVQNPDLIDQANTVLKIAKKRALVDASIALARCSDIFTQDVEDFAGNEPAEGAGRGKPHPVMSTPAQQQEIHRHLKALGLEWDSPKARQATASAIRRQLGDRDGPDRLTAAEAETVLAELSVAVGQKKAKAFARGLREADALLAGKGLCPLGSLLAHVTQAGVTAGYSSNLEDWPTAAFELAERETAAYKAKLAKAPAAETREEAPRDREPGEDDGEGDTPEPAHDHGDPVGEQAPPASASPPLNTLPGVTQKALLDALHKLDLAWHDAKTKARVAEILGRPVGAGDHISQTTVDEANKLLAAFNDGIKKRTEKAAARKEKAGAA